MHTVTSFSRPDSPCSTFAHWPGIYLAARPELQRPRFDAPFQACLHARAGAPDDIAKAVTFLACDDSSYVNGTELFVDDGVAQI